MHSPYTAHFDDAVAIAQTSVAVVLTAVVWQSPLRPKIACVPLLIAIWLLAIATFEPAVLAGVGVTVGPNHFAFLLTLSRIFAVLAFALVRPRWLVASVIAGAVVLWRLGEFLQDFEVGLAVLHMSFFALAHAVHTRFASPVPASPVRVHRGARALVIHDAALFFVAIALACVVCIQVLERSNSSGDEWADTYQADLFAHLLPYGDVPPCPGLFRNYWVFFHLGRSFAQYTPGWPLLMAPFQRLGIVWVASPFIFGVLCVGVARLARRAAAADPSADARQVAWAGTIAGLCTLLPVGMLLNAASRFPHISTAAAFAWSVECACAVVERGISRRAQWLWGLGLGFSTSMMLSIRHGDGAMLGIGIFFVFAYWLVRRRVRWRAFAGATISFSIVSAVSLIILRLQLGEWFVTGYSIAHVQIMGGAKFSMPKPNEFKWGIPLDTGSYMWWPCAPAIGVAGLALARGRGMAIALMLIIGSMASTAMYTAIEFGRGWDSGYGPRYQLTSVVAMAVGAAVLLAPMVRDAQRRIGPSLRQAGPLVLAAAAMITGLLRIGPLVYSEAYAEVHHHNTFERALAAANLKHAVVSVTGGPELEVGVDPLDLVQNLPTEKDPNLLILLRRGGAEGACGRRRFADRQWYRAVSAGSEVRVIPD